MSERTVGMKKRRREGWMRNERGKERKVEERVEGKEGGSKGE